VFLSLEQIDGCCTIAFSTAGYLFALMYVYQTRALSEVVRVYHNQVRKPNSNFLSPSTSDDCSCRRSIANSEAVKAAALEEAVILLPSAQFDTIMITPDLCHVHHFPCLSWICTKPLPLLGYSQTRFIVMAKLLHWPT